MLRRASMLFSHPGILVMIPRLMRPCLDVISQSAIRCLHSLPSERAGPPALLLRLIVTGGLAAPAPVPAWEPAAFHSGAMCRGCRPAPAARLVSVVPAFPG